jgi:hypothetical protein
MIPGKQRAAAEGCPRLPLRFHTLLTGGQLHSFCNLYRPAAGVL